MGNIEAQQKCKGFPGALVRPEYKVGNSLAAGDLLIEQRYRWQRLRRHNRYLHGWGVVCGLWVVPVNDPVRPWAVQVCPGYAIGPCGDEIEVQEPAAVNIRDHIWKRLPTHEAPANVAYIGIRYAEQQVRPVPARQPVCGCDDTVYRPSRIRDSFQVDVLWTLPQVDETVGFDLCEQRLAPCPDRPESLYVILAWVTLPASEGDPIIMSHIDNFAGRQRRQLSSTGILQEQVIACCCAEKTAEDP